jgi:type 1 fimbria pilin
MNFKILIGGAALCVLGGYSAVAQATCNISSGSVLTGSVNFGNVVVQRDAPIGSQLAVASFVGTGPTIRCTTPWTHVGTPLLFPNISSYGNRVYDTNIEGVGIQLHYASWIGSNLPFSRNSTSASISVSGTMTARLIKTSAGATESGVLTTGRLSVLTADGLEAYNLNLTGTNTITPVACSVRDTAINVTMGNVPRNRFPGVGGWVEGKNFSISLNCDMDTRINFKLDAMADSSGAPGVISLNSAAIGSAASGVGLQVLYNGNPVTLGRIIPAGVSSTDGQFDIPFYARYYQTTPNVTAGQANATATFTMTYN